MSAAIHISVVLNSGDELRSAAQPYEQGGIGSVRFLPLHAAHSFSVQSDDPPLLLALADAAQDAARKVRRLQIDAAIKAAVA